MKHKPTKFNMEQFMQRANPISYSDRMKNFAKVFTPKTSMTRRKLMRRQIKSNERPALKIRTDLNPYESYVVRVNSNTTEKELATPFKINNDFNSCSLSASKKPSCTRKALSPQPRLNKIITYPERELYHKVIKDQLNGVKVTFKDLMNISPPTTASPHFFNGKCKRILNKSSDETQANTTIGHSEKFPYPTPYSEVKKQRKREKQGLRNR